MFEVIEAGQDTAAMNGTHLQGQIPYTYHELETILGPPTIVYEPGQKTDVEWVLRVKDATGSGEEVIATIYNFKNGINYLGPDRGTPLSEMMYFNVGGHDERAIRLVNHIMVQLANLVHH